MSKTIKMAAGDILIDSIGRTVEIDKLEKCAQDIAEAYLNVYDPEDPPWYPTGSEFWRIDQQVYVDNASSISLMLESMAQSALERLIEAQEDDPYVDDEELIAEIRSIRTWKIGQLSWAFHSYCLTDSDEYVETGFDIDLSQQLPSSVNPDGDQVIGRGVFI